MPFYGTGIACRRRAFAGKPKPSSGKKNETYWDRVSWDMDPPPFFPDKWYIRVMWVAVVVSCVLHFRHHPTLGRHGIDGMEQQLPYMAEVVAANLQLNLLKAT